MVKNASPLSQHPPNSNIFTKILPLQLKEKHVKGVEKPQ